MTKASLYSLVGNATYRWKNRHSSVGCICILNKDIVTKNTLVVFRDIENLVLYHSFSLFFNIRTNFGFMGLHPLCDGVKVPELYNSVDW